MALAIELAAARFPSLGLDGLEAGLPDRLRLLTGGSRVDDRHRSLRSTLDWSYALLDGSRSSRAAPGVRLRQPFPSDRRGGPPRRLASGRRRGARHPGRPGRPEPAGRHRCTPAAPATAPWRPSVSTAPSGFATPGSWSRPSPGTSGGAWTRAPRSSVASHQDLPGWRVAFDVVADELRGALAWAAGESRAAPRGVPVGPRAGRARLPTRHARRGAAPLRAGRRAGPGRSRRRRRPGATPPGRRSPGTWAPTRCACAARPPTPPYARGDRAGAAADLARNAELINRGPGLMATEPPADDVAALLGEGRALAGDDLAAQARLLTAEAFAGDVADPATVGLVERAISLAQRHRGPVDRERRTRPAHGHPAGARRGPGRAGQRAAAHRAAGPAGGGAHGRAGVPRQPRHGRRLRHRRRRPPAGPAARREAPGPALPPRGGAPGDVPARWSSR